MVCSDYLDYLGWFVDISIRGLILGLAYTLTLVSFFSKHSVHPFSISRFLSVKSLISFS